MSTGFELYQVNSETLETQLIEDLWPRWIRELSLSPQGSLAAVITQEEGNDAHDQVLIYSVQ